MKSVEHLAQEACAITGGLFNALATRGVPFYSDIRMHLGGDAAIVLVHQTTIRVFGLVREELSSEVFLAD